MIHRTDLSDFNQGLPMLTNRSLLVFLGFILLLPWPVAWLARQLVPGIEFLGNPWSYHGMLAFFTVGILFCLVSDHYDRRRRFPEASMTHPVWGTLSRPRGKECWCGGRLHPELGSMNFTVPGAAEPNDAQFAALSVAWEKLTEVDGQVKAHPEYRGEKLLGLYVSLESWSLYYDLGLNAGFEDDGTLSLYRMYPIE
jgi:hypothetical protein